MQGLGILAAMSLSLMLLLVDDADGAVGVEWDEVRRSVTPHQVTPRTHPVEDGRATAIIAVPEDPRYQTAAEALQRSIQQQTGVQVPLVSAAELVTGPAFAFKPNASHLILLGDLTSNPAIARLYMDYVAFEDAAYPGQGGHTVRSVVDPLGLGWNAVILGGQGPDEVAAAVDEYVGLIDARDGEAYSEYCLRVTLGEHPFLAEMQRRTDAAREWLGGWDTDLLPPGSEEYKAKNPGKTPVQYVFVLLDRHLVYDGLHYGITGEREFAEAAGRAIDALYENLEWVEAHRKAPYDAHYMVEIWLRAWQQVANCPYLTSGQRDRGHAVMGFLAGQMAAYRPDHQAYGVTSYRILSRHQYSGIFGGDALCGWAQRHCELGPELSDSIALTRERFGIVIDAMTQTYTTGFDHKWGFDGNWHLLQAAVEGPRTEHITTGLARLNADFATMCINNAGEFVNFGAENIAATEAYDAYQILGRTETLLRDGRYQWWLDERMKRHPYKIFIMSINWLGHWYHTSVPAREPTHLIGINRILAPAPLHEDLIKGRGRTHGGNPVVNDVPLGETFNKISFRDGLGEDDQYLLLDGLGGTTYSGNDANGISEYSRYGERLLVQLTPKHEPFYQNTVSVSRGNAGDPAGTFARLVEMADIGPLAYTKSVVDPLTGCGNTRHVFMEKGRHVVLFDDVALHQDGEHSIACTFRGLGEPEVDRANGTWRLRGAKADLFLQNVSAPGSPAPRLDGSVRDVGGSFGGTAFDVQVLRETVAGEFSTDETYRFANLFYGHQPDEEPARKAVPLGRDAIAVRGDETVVYGAPLEGTTRKGGLSITAAAFRLARESVQFVRLKNIEFDGEPVIDFREPVTLSVDLANETCTWQASDSECTETIVWEPTWRMTSTLAQVGAGIELPTGETVRLRAQAFLRGVEAVMAVADQAQPARPTEPPPATLPLVASARELLPPEAPISDLTFADLDGDGVDEIICAREDGHLVAARAAQGADTWEHYQAAKPTHARGSAMLYGGEAVAIAGALALGGAIVADRTDRVQLGPGGLVVPW